MMALETKQPIKLYFDDLTNTVEKILNKRPESSDFDKLEELLEVGGLSKDTIKGIYKRCGFESLDDYLNRKFGLCSDEEEISVNCVEQKIKGALSSLGIVFSKKLYGQYYLGINFSFPLLLSFFNLFAGCYCFSHLRFD